MYIVETLVTDEISLFIAVLCIIYNFSVMCPIHVSGRAFLFSYKAHVDEEDSVNLPS